LRIIAGQFRGRKLASVKKTAIRPTSDRVREALFNILGRKPMGSAVLDLFSGTGALGLEALSRGARTCVFVDNDERSLAVLRRNISLCKVMSCATVIRWDIANNLSCLNRDDQGFDLIFMDPPYGLGLIEKTMVTLIRQDILLPEALVVAEHPCGEAIDLSGTGLHIVDHRRYGSSTLSFMSIGP
jgi:16S rRNA (guanine966-N2)-methyltransferase